MPEVKDALTSNEIANMNTSKTELDKLVAEAKKLDEKAKDYTDLADKVKSKNDAIKDFLGDAGKKHIGQTPQKNDKYATARKELTELVNMAKKAVTALKAAKEKFERDKLTDAHVTALKGAKEKLDQMVEMAAKEGPGTDHQKSLLAAIKECGDLSAKIDTCKSNIGKVTKEFKDFVNTNANLLKLLGLAKTAVENIRKENAEPWTVTCHSAVSGWASGKSDDKLSKAMESLKHPTVKDNVLHVGGVRHIVGNVYDVGGKDFNDRYVGVVDIANKSFAFKAVYQHPKGGGKEFKGGERVGAYG